MEMMRGSYIDENYNYFIEADLSQFQGKYVAIHDKMVQFSGDDLQELYNLMKEKYPDIIPFITKVCTGQAMIL